MKRRSTFVACLALLLLPRPSLACGGCTDAVLLMTLPWAGFGILLLWLWIFAMLATRWCLRRRGSSNATDMVGASTLVTFAALGSIGYAGLALAMGSLLVPSLLLGFVLIGYLVVQVVANGVRFVRKCDSGFGTPLAMHSTVLIIAIVLIGHFQSKANTLDHRVGCLRFGRHAVLYSKIMPSIVADGQKAVGPLIRAADEAIGNRDGYTRMNTMKHATFCLGRIGGFEVEEFLSELVKQHANPSDYYDRTWYRGACLAYARCAGPRAANDLVVLFENAPATEERDDRAFLLVALAMTASNQGVAVALDHMDLLLERMKRGGNASEMRVFQAATERLVFETDPKALTQIPAYRDSWLVGAVGLAEPRPNDYMSEFFWTKSSEDRLRPTEEIEAAWRKDSTSIRKRWADLLK
jgi:hypothetical protein